MYFYKMDTNLLLQQLKHSGLINGVFMQTYGHNPKGVVMQN